MPGHMSCRAVGRYVAATASGDGKVLGAVGNHDASTAFDGHCSLSRHVLPIHAVFPTVYHCFPWAMPSLHGSFQIRGLSVRSRQV